MGLQKGLHHDQKDKLMNKKWKAKWLKALRSGAYSQGRNYLASEESGTAKFCCLGVLVDMDEGFDEKTYNQWDGTPGRKALVADKNESVLTARLMTRYGLTDVVMDNLIEMNDDKRNRFTTIANWIEKNL
jgi:hypothetical protein